MMICFWHCKKTPLWSTKDPQPRSLQGGRRLNQDQAKSMAIRVVEFSNRGWGFGTKFERRSNFGTFWHLPINPNQKFNNFLWVGWFLGKNLANFIPLVWKLHNPYCHTLDMNEKIQFHAILTINITYKSMYYGNVIVMCP